MFDAIFPYFTSLQRQHPIGLELELNPSRSCKPDSGLVQVFLKMLWEGKQCKYTVSDFPEQLWFKKSFLFECITLITPREHEK